MNSSQKLIEKNNSLRKELNLKNEVFYSDFLIYMRLGSITKKETIVENIYNGLIEKDSINKDFYTSNKVEYIKKLDDLDNKFKDLALHSKTKEID